MLTFLLKATPFLFLYELGSFGNALILDCSGITGVCLLSVLWWFWDRSESTGTVQFMLKDQIWEWELFYGKERQGRARSCNNCPPGNWWTQLFRDNSWQSGWHQLLLTLFVTVSTDTVQTHTHTHVHAHTPVDSYLLSYSTAGPPHAWASLDRWPPNTPMVARHGCTTTTHSPATASQLSLFGSVFLCLWYVFMCPSNHGYTLWARDWFISCMIQQQQQPLRPHKSSSQTQSLDKDLLWWLPIHVLKL